MSVHSEKTSYQHGIEALSWLILSALSAANVEWTGLHYWFLDVSILSVNTYILNHEPIESGQLFIFLCKDMNMCPQRAIYLLMPNIIKQEYFVI